MKRLILSTSEATGLVSCVADYNSTGSSYFTYGFELKTGPFGSFMFLPGYGTREGRIGFWVDGVFQGFDGLN